MLQYEHTNTVFVVFSLSNSVLNFVIFSLIGCFVDTYPLTEFDKFSEVEKMFFANLEISNLGVSIGFSVTKIELKSGEATSQTDFDKFDDNFQREPLKVS